MKRIWNLTYSNRGGFRVNLTTTNIFWDVLADIGEFVTHHFIRFIPRLPIPYLHKDFDYCGKNNVHFHNPYTWFGWNYEDQICMGLCLFFDNKSFRSEKILYTFDVSDEMMQQFFIKDIDLLRFYNSVKESRDEN